MCNHKQCRTIILACFFIGGLMAGFITNSLAQTMGAETTSSDRECFRCHYCPKPTKDDLCLHLCPRHHQDPDTDLKTPVDYGPDMVTLDTLVDMYEPTFFNHKIHAQMASMSHGCLECHHYSPEGEYPACSTCHSVGISCENLKQVGLKGAYHRQCMRCHMDWSGDENCEVCHARKGSDAQARPTKDKPLRHYPLVEEPGIDIYTSTFLGESKVTFDHRSHAHDFDIACQTCHHGPGCLPCHSQKVKMPGPTPDAVGCLACHRTTSCTTCHVVPPDTPPFDHSKTKFPIKKYHANLGCRDCHTIQARHHIAPTECTECHGKNWKPKKFTHSMVGLKLDETHSELECENCHPDRKYNAPPSCADCHEDMSYPDAVPGEKK